MNPETAKETKTPATRRAYSRGHLLGGFVAVLLVMWGIKAIHYALQPKYQGKTMEEWFAASHSADEVLKRGYPLIASAEDQALAAMLHFGTNAVRYLWKEYRRDDHTLTVRLRDLWAKHVLNRTSSYQFDSQTQRRVRAEALLMGMRSNAHFLIHELVLQVDGRDTEESVRGAVWLGLLQMEPEVCVPALIRAITETNRIPPVNRAIYIVALGRFGRNAEAALPLLMELHDDPTIHLYDKRYVVAAIVQIDGAREKSEYIERVLDPHDSGTTIMALMIPARNGKLPPTVLPYVRELASRVTDPRHIQYLTNVISILETTKRP